ncbi:MAG: sigma-54 interaction domain-containing protein [Methylocystaceae bacterium]
MVDLLDVQDYAQQIAEAIATVTNIDVEIADNNLIRVAGTGIYREGIGSSMDRQGFVYREVLTSGKALIIEKPGYHELCRPCKRWNNCPEKYEIVYPINVGNRTLGAFGLLCFSDETMELVRKHQKSYQDFLGKMAETFGLKLQEREFTDRLISSNRYLTSIINCLEEGLITADSNGRVTHYNQVAYRLFGYGANLADLTLEALLGTDLAQEVLQLVHLESGTLEKEVTINQDKLSTQLAMRARSIITETGVRSIVITFNHLSELSLMVNRLAPPEASYSINDLLGSSESMRSIRERAGVIAQSNSTVLITGESGTGKEMLARAIHDLSPRRDGPFVAINCSAIPEALLESELYGYEAGAFTGARKGGKIGKFELADRGTFFLDEIGDMPLFLQAKLLRVLQDRQVERVGGLKPIPVDVRIIAATHRNLEGMIKQGEFREDLYYRINVIPINIAPLRERKDDLQELCWHFLNHYNQQLHKQVEGWSADFMEVLKNYGWPGNVRELQNVIEYAMNITSGTILEVEHLPAKTRLAISNEKNINYNLYQLEKDMIMRSICDFGDTYQGKENAAQALGIGIATLYRKLNQYSKDELLSN